MFVVVTNHFSLDCMDLERVSVLNITYTKYLGDTLIQTYVDQPHQIEQVNIFINVPVLQCISTQNAWDHTTII